MAFVPSNARAEFVEAFRVAAALAHAMATALPKDKEWQSKVAYSDTLAAAEAKAEVDGAAALELWGIKEFDLAVSAYKKALEKDAKYAPAYSGLGDAYRLTGERDKAAEAYRKALELGKNYALVHYKIGLLWEETKPAEAIKAFEKYLASDKNPDFQTEAKAKIEKLKNVTASQSQGKQ